MGDKGDESYKDGGIVGGVKALAPLEANVVHGKLEGLASREKRRRREKLLRRTPPPDLPKDYASTRRRGGIGTVRYGTALDVPRCLQCSAVQYSKARAALPVACKGARLVTSGSIVQYVLIPRRANTYRRVRRVDLAPLQ